MRIVAKRLDAELVWMHDNLWIHCVECSPGGAAAFEAGQTAWAALKGKPDLESGAGAA